MNLYYKTLVAALFPLLIAALVSIFYIDKIASKQAETIKERLHIEADGISKSIHNHIKELTKVSNILSSSTEIANGVISNDNDLLFNWGRLFLNENIDKITFVGLDGAVISKAHNEFDFGDSLYQTPLFKKIVSNKSITTLQKDEEKLLLVYAETIKKYGEIESGIVIAEKYIDRAFIKNLENGTSLELLISSDRGKVENIKKESIFFKRVQLKELDDDLGYIIALYSTTSSEIKNFNELKSNVISGFLLLMLLLFGSLLFVMKKHLYPYQKLLVILNRYRESGYELEKLSLESHNLSKEFPQHEIGKIAKSLSLSTKKAAENQEEIKRINRHLDERIKEEILKNEKNQKLLIFRDRQAQVGMMMSGLIHQWKQPLSAIGLNANVINDIIEYDEIIDKKEIEKSLISIENQLQFIEQTNRNLSSFFRVGKDNEFFDIGESIKTVIDLFGSIFKQNSIEIYFENRANIFVSGNKNEFMQVILNIIDNAKDQIIASNIPKGKIEIKIKTDDFVEIGIEDNGGGVPDENLKNIFEYQFSTKGEKGSGIGLFLAKKIVEESMHGTIYCENGENGALFTIKLILGEKK